MFGQGAGRGRAVVSRDRAARTSRGPRRSFREVGLWAAPPAGGALSNEELDLCYRLERLGGRVLYIPGAVVYHMMDPGRVTVDWFRRRFYWQGKADAYFDLVHQGEDFVAERLIGFARAAVAKRVRRGRSPSSSPPQLCHLGDWRGLRRGGGARVGDLDRLPRPSRIRPPPFLATRRRARAAQGPSFRRSRVPQRRVDERLSSANPSGFSSVFWRARLPGRGLPSHDASRRTVYVRSGSAVHFAQKGSGLSGCSAA